MQHNGTWARIELEMSFERKEKNDAVFGEEVVKNNLENELKK